jgi:hypothetical protein
MKLEVNNKSSSRKYSNTWILNNTFLLSQWVIEEIRDEIKKLLEFNENKHTTYQNLWDTGKAVLRGKLIALRPYIKRTETSQINDLMLQLKLLEKQEQANPKTSRREIIKIRAQINEIETTTKKVERINEKKAGT